MLLLLVSLLVYSLLYFQLCLLKAILWPLVGHLPAMAVTIVQLRKLDDVAHLSPVTRVATCDVFNVRMGLILKKVFDDRDATFLEEDCQGSFAISVCVVDIGASRDQLRGQLEVVTLQDLGEDRVTEVVLNVDEHTSRGEIINGLKVAYCSCIQ